VLAGGAQNGPLEMVPHEGAARFEQLGEEGK
jgi:hypothetical protein